MENNDKPKEKFYPYLEYDDATPAIFHSETPEKITQDLLRLEKSMADEVLASTKGRLDAERLQWEKIYEQKEKEMMEMKRTINESNDKLKRLKMQFEEERYLNLEQIKDNSKEMERKRANDIKKWDEVSTEVKDFREISRSSQKELADEKAKVKKFRELLISLEDSQKIKLLEKEEEICNQNEISNRKEQDWLKSQSVTAEKIRILQEQVSSLQNNLNDERQYQSKVIEQKDEDIKKYQDGLHNAIIQFNEEVIKNNDLNERCKALHNSVKDVEERLKSLQQSKEEELLEYKKVMQVEHVKFENAIQEFEKTVELTEKDASEIIDRLTRSISILEEQLGEEKAVRADMEKILSGKEIDIDVLLKEKAAIIAEHNKLFSEERENAEIKQRSILEEYERIRNSKKEEFSFLHSEIRKVETALTEENRLSEILKEENGQLIGRLERLGEDKQRLIIHVENKEKEWQNILLSEQELLHKQIEELRAKNEAQILSREMEIGRLNEDLQILNGQMLEIRQKFSIEKNENNSRLSRIQEYEVQNKIQSEMYKHENNELQRELIFIKEQMEEQRKRFLSYSQDLENMYKNDMELYGIEKSRMLGNMKSLKKRESVDSNDDEIVI